LGLCKSVKFVNAPFLSVIPLDPSRLKGTTETAKRASDNNDAEDYEEKSPFSVVTHYPHFRATSGSRKDFSQPLEVLPRQRREMLILQQVLNSTSSEFEPANEGMAFLGYGGLRHEARHLLSELLGLFSIRHPTFKRIFDRDAVKNPT
jgi:hypothetical protein